MKINMNADVKVTLTARGEEILRQSGEAGFHKDGRFLLWELFYIFGKEMKMGEDIVFVKNSMEISDEF